ncbi:MAG: efflux RND transporter periplasmic adaptor subunit [Acidobacteriota bacterium]|nr:efflux RND transporter periplasmic adaptor subunit [Acidobacteriota bacterium]
MRRALYLTLALCTLAACSKNGNLAKQASSKQAGKGQPAGNGQSTSIQMDSQVQQKIGLQVIEVQARAVPLAFTAPGQIMLNEERTVHVGSYVDGRVVEVKAPIGAHVSKGMVLARLHSHTVHETRAALASAEQEVSRQEEVVDYRRRMRDKMQRLLALKSASPQEVERAQTDLQSAQTDLQNARINRQKETIHLADILGVPESDLAKVNEESELAPVLAPISGLVIDRKVTLGTIVEPGQETFTITDLGTVWMIASVNEMDLAKLHAGSIATVTSQAYPDQAFEGKVTFLAPQVDPQTRTLQARILLMNRGDKLHPGMFANAQIQQGSSRRAIFVPERAIQELNGGSVVFARTGDKSFEPRPIKIARRMNGEAEVSAGLKNGDSIVTDGSFVVKSELLKSQIGQ